MVGGPVRTRAKQLASQKKHAHTARQKGSLLRADEPTRPTVGIIDVAVPDGRALADEADATAGVADHADRISPRFHTHKRYTVQYCCLETRATPVAARYPLGWLRACQRCFQVRSVPFALGSALALQA